MSDVKVVDIGEKQRDKIKDAIRDMQAQLPLIVAGQQAMAKATRAKYLALVEEGFSASEALELCK
jgi:lactam utilization protein B